MGKFKYKIIAFATLTYILIIGSCDDICKTNVLFNEEKNTFQRIQYYYNTCNLKKITDILDSVSYICNGEDVTYFQNGNLKSKYSYKEGRPFGDQFEFFQNGKVKVYFFCIKQHFNNCRYYFDSIGNILSREGNLLYYYLDEDSSKKLNNLSGLLYVAFPEKISTLKIFQNNNLIGSNIDTTYLLKNQFGKHFKIDINPIKGENNIKFIIETRNNDIKIQDSLCVKFIKQKYWTVID